jgi:hypothetical protein
VKREFTFEIPDEPHTLHVPFDSDPEARYEVELMPADVEDGDGIVLFVTPKACIAFAALFVQLSEKGGHVHLGYSEENPQGPGIRIQLSHDGRSRKD